LNEKILIIKGKTKQKREYHAKLKSNYNENHCSETFKNTSKIWSFKIRWSCLSVFYLYFEFYKMFIISDDFEMIELIAASV
jgi:hypothetical protein